MKQFILVILVLSLGLSVVFAQGERRGHKHHHPKLNQEARAALHEFQKETIYPVKKAAHDQFLATLSQEDRRFLEEKRAEGKAMHQEMRALRQEMKGLRERGKSREEMQEIRKEKFAPLKEKRHAFMESMKPFMEKNKALIQTSMEPMKENREAWKAKKKAIIEEYLSEEERAEMEACKKQKGEGRHRGEHHAGKEGKQHEGRKGKKAVRFVLWDGQMKAPKGDQEQEHKNSSETIGNLSQANTFTLSTYPNPAISQTTILLNLSEASRKVNIRLTNAEGQQVWSKTYHKLTKGAHQIDVNLEKLVSGNYFCTVEIGEKRISKPFVVNK